MCISNTTSCSDWEPYTISKSWTLTSGYGEKKVYIWFKDAAGNISTMYSDSITLGMNLHDYLINNSVSGLKKVYIGKDNLYRFSGTSGNSGINNYICLGAASCSSSSDNMYRILGVNPSNGEVKVVKATTYNNGTKYVWHNSMANINWLTSDLYKNTVSKIYDNLSFKNMIVQNHIWNIGAAATHTGLTSREIVIDYEDNATGYATMGIISLTDFYLAYNGTRNWFSSYDTSTNWLNIGQSVYEWTMTYYGLTSDVYIAWNFMEGIGYSPDWYLNYANTIRPTFYLKPEVLWVEGDGTVNAPFKVGININ